MDLSNLIESILFWKGEPLSIKRLCEITNKNVEEVNKGLNILESKLSDRGIVLMRKEDEVMLGTCKESSFIIENLIKEELHRDLGKAGLEALSIVLYLGPISRSEIDYIRGVNSSFIMRNLLIRGLIERVDNPLDKRSFVYKPTFELQSYLGLSKIEDLPEYEHFKKEIADRIAKKESLDQEIRNAENILSE